MSGIFYRPAQAQGTVEIIEKTERKVQEASTEQNRSRASISIQIEEGQENKKYTKKSLILAQDER